MKSFSLSVSSQYWAWWRHQMGTFSALLALCVGNTPVTGEFLRGIHRWRVNSPHKGQWRGALMFSLVCGWIDGWVNHREAGDLRRHRAQYDVLVLRYDRKWKYVLSNKFSETRQYSDSTKQTVDRTYLVTRDPSLTWIEFNPSSDILLVKVNIRNANDVRARAPIFDSEQLFLKKSTFHEAWWRHQMETFSTLLALYEGNSPVTDEFPSTKANDAELWCFLWSAPEQKV